MALGCSVAGPLEKSVSVTAHRRCDAFTSTERQFTATVRLKADTTDVATLVGLQADTADVGTQAVRRVE